MLVAARVPLEDQLGAEDEVLIEEIRDASGELDEFADLLVELEEAVASGDAAGVGRVALRSGAIHQRYRPHAEWERLTVRAMAGGALGVALAHSGTVAGVLWRSY